MQPLTLDDAETMLTVTIKADGQEVTQVLDLAEIWIGLREINQKTKESDRAWLAGIVAYLKELGFPTASMTTARRFWESINKAMEALKKSDGASKTPASPASTAPQS